LEDERRGGQTQPLINVIVVGEGQTEETFVRDVLAPELWGREVYLHSRLIWTSPHSKGGALAPDRVLRFLRNTLRERNDTYVTTLFDLYGLRVDFPGVADAAVRTDPIARCEEIENKLEEQVVSMSGCRADRFLAHVQPYEFEALLFSDVSQFAQMQSEWERFVVALQAARDEAQSPEHINDGPLTHPSARLENLLRPSYRKPLHGSAVAKRVGIERIRNECQHFGSWLARIEKLPPLE
jgi:hypothetical protein